MLLPLIRGFKTDIESIEIWKGRCHKFMFFNLLEVSEQEETYWSSFVAMLIDYGYYVFWFFAFEFFDYCNRSCHSENY